MSLLQPINSFNRQWVVKNRRLVESRPEILDEIQQAWKSLEFDELFKDGLLNEFVSPTDAIHLIQTLAEADVAVAYFLLSDLHRLFLQARLANPLPNAAVMPFEHFSFLVASTVSSGTIMCKLEENGVRIEYCRPRYQEQQRYMGFRGVPFVKRSGAESCETLALISLSSYQDYLKQIGLLCQALHAGLLKAAIDYAYQYAKERQAFGRPIIKLQAISQKLAHMAIAQEAAAAALFDNAEHLANISCGEITASLELFIKNGDFVLQEAVQTLGGHGYLEDHPVEKWMRDGQVLKAILLEIKTAIQNTL